MAETARRTAELRAVVPQDEFRRAIEGKQLVLHYQPIVSLDTGRVRGAEALLRWKHPNGALLMPDDFLPAITHTPVMRLATQWVLNEACRQAAQWPNRGVAVNVSASDVVRPDFVADVTRALDISGLDADRLSIELTEHAVVQDLEAAVQALAALREMGVKVSLDDFGTGYSSLFYLRELPISEVKIDRVFIDRVDADDEDAAIVDSVVRLARTVGVTAVAEGVERAAQASLLMAMGCPAAQGYLWGRPEPDPDIARQTVPLPEAPIGARRRRRRDGTPESDDAMVRIRALLAAGASLHTIAAALNRDAVPSARGTRWTAASVAHALQGEQR
ncbi:MAG TPA: EAL domain-containing protein [Mycobacteriales bacterium]|nr:EAL domain-containing protein [Mycobacteriales bacterium]